MLVLCWDVMLPSARSSATKLALALKPEIDAGKIPDERMATNILLPSQGLHEIYASAYADGPSAAACALALVRTQRSSPRQTSCLWIRHSEINRETGAPSIMGVAAFGLRPEHVILVEARDTVLALQAALEGARTPGLGTVILELWGDAKAYDLTASRRLALAAKASGVLLLVTRIAASPCPSVAETRWMLRAAPSRALAARAPGHPAFEMTLIKARSRQEGLQIKMEWDRDARKLIASDGSIFGTGTDATTEISVASGADTITAHPDAAALSGRVVALSFDRPARIHEAAEPEREQRRRG
jgi:protein ImuA